MSFIALLGLENLWQRLNLLDSKMAYTFVAFLFVIVSSLESCLRISKVSVWGNLMNRNMYRFISFF